MTVNRPNLSEDHVGSILPHACHHHHPFRSEISVDTTPKLQHFPESSWVFPLVMTCSIKWKMFYQQFSPYDVDNSMGISCWTIKIRLERKKRHGGTVIQTPARAAGRVQEKLWLRYLPEGEATCVWGLMWCCPGGERQEEAVLTCCEHLCGNVTYRREIQDFSPQAASPGASGAELHIAPSVCMNAENPLAFVVLSFKQQTVVSFCFAVRGAREPLLSQA